MSAFESRSLLRRLEGGDDLFLPLQQSVYGGYLTVFSFEESRK
jgi:hypothetical protein